MTPATPAMATWPRGIGVEKPADTAGKLCAAGLYDRSLRKRANGVGATMRVPKASAH